MTKIANLCTPIPGPRSRDLATRLKKTECQNITYLRDDFPVFWERAFGCNVEDVDGNRFVDFSSAFGVATLGHSDSSIVEAIRTQSEKLSHGMGDVHPPAIKVELLEKLQSIVPLANPKTILCSSGAEAVEAALKTAFLATHRPGVLVFDGAYHGLTYGTLAVSGNPRFRDPFAKQIASIAKSVPLPRKMDESLEQIESALVTAEKNATPIGAILCEPVFGRAGVVVPPHGWLSHLREIATRRNVLLIADEIMTGFGRTGEWFSVNHEAVLPDLLCIGKSFSGSLPFSACIGSEDVMNVWPLSEGEALHTSTFLGHPLGCAAALASMREIEKRNLPQRASEVGNQIMQQIQGWSTSIPIVSDIRGQGLMLGIELTQSERKGLAFDTAKAALQKGLILLPSGQNGNVISLTPPLTISEEPLAWGLLTLKNILEAL